jgi:hypothetical protein
MKRYAAHLLFALTLGLALISAANAATGAASAPPGGSPPGPPPEAIAACAGKTEGTTVSFVTRGGQTFSGVCQKFGDVLAARPAGGGPPPR